MFRLGEQQEEKGNHVCVKVILSFPKGLMSGSGLNVLFKWTAAAVWVNISTLTLSGWDGTMFLGITGG